MPKTIAFILDQECMSVQERKELQWAGRGLVYFLPRRMYENYLLHPEAVAEVMNGIEGFRRQPISGDELREVFARKRTEVDPRDPTGRQLMYFCKGTVEVPEDWECVIHSADLLKDVFKEVSETRVQYEKTKHSVAITECLIRRKSESLADLGKWLVRLLWPS